MECFTYSWLMCTGNRKLQNDEWHFPNNLNQTIEREKKKEPIKELLQWDLRTWNRSPLTLSCKTFDAVSRDAHIRWTKSVSIHVFIRTCEHGQVFTFRSDHLVSSINPYLSFPPVVVFVKRTPSSFSRPVYKKTETNTDTGRWCWFGQYCKRSW